MKKNTLSAIFITLFLLISCNNNAESEGAVIGSDNSQSKFLSSLVDLGNNFSKALMTFSEEVAKFLGLTKKVDAKTAKGAVGTQVAAIAEALMKLAKEFEAVAVKTLEAPEPKAGAVAKVEAVAGRLMELSKQVVGKIGDTDKVGTDDGTNLKKMDEAGAEVAKIASTIKSLVELIIPGGKIEAAGTKSKVADAGAGKGLANTPMALFVTDATGAKDGKAKAVYVATSTNGAKAAQAIVGKATGEGMLKAIAEATSGTEAIEIDKDSGDDKKPKKEDVEKVATAGAVSLAGGGIKLGKIDADAQDIDMDGVKAIEIDNDVFAAAVALRALSEKGKFNSADDKDAKNEVGEVAAQAVKKLLGEIASTIKSFVDKETKEIQKNIAAAKAAGPKEDDSTKADADKTAVGEKTNKTK
ncbi:variable large family protein [Candidatus Borreliella tachyglossi]|uniref:variable large family protein n=1 Tax=Candidatus Borreliella tachyglossi TaxID=1964448 RepID=UPI0040437C1D